MLLQVRRQSIHQYGQPVPPHLAALGVEVECLVHHSGQGHLGGVGGTKVARAVAVEERAGQVGGSTASRSRGAYYFEK